jgi:hypothetical protein
MKKIVRLSETDLVRLVKRVIKEGDSSLGHNSVDDYLEQLGEIKDMFYQNDDMGQEEKDEIDNQLVELFSNVVRDYDNGNISKEEYIHIGRLWGSLLIKVN